MSEGYYTSIGKRLHGLLSALRLPARFIIHDVLHQSGIVESVWARRRDGIWKPKFVVHWPDGRRTIRAYFRKDGTQLLGGGKTQGYLLYDEWCRWMSAPIHNYEYAAKHNRRSDPDWFTYDIAEFDQIEFNSERQIQ